MQNKIPNVNILLGTLLNTDHKKYAKFNKILALNITE